jgi:hypothetical protein
MDDESRQLLERLVNEIEKIRHLIEIKMREEAVMHERAAAVASHSANVAYLSSKWPRRDGDKLVKSPA